MLALLVIYRPRTGLAKRRRSIGSTCTSINRCDARRLNPASTWRQLSAKPARTFQGNHTKDRNTMTPQDMESPHRSLWRSANPAKPHSSTPTHRAATRKRTSPSSVAGSAEIAGPARPHRRCPHGFNIGAAGQPPKCRNSLHDHHTAEAFFVLSGRWRFFWGRWGDAGEVILGTW